MNRKINSQKNEKENLLSEEPSDRRTDSRVNYEVASEIEFDIKNSPINHEKGTATHISQSGMTFLTSVDIPEKSEVIIRLFLKKDELPIQLTGLINWSKPTPEIKKYGITFTHIPNIYFKKINLFLREHLGNKSRITERRITYRIRSQLLEVENNVGHKISGFIDTLESLSTDSPTIIIPSPYGETKIHSLQLAYTLALNGYRVIRFDPTNHVGESDGIHLDYTLSGLTSDIVSCIKFATQNYPESKIAVIASSLAARAAIKACARLDEVSLFISLVGVTNLQHTLAQVQNDDLVNGYLAGKRWGIGPVIGHQIKMDNFLNDAIDENFSTLQSTEKDIRNIQCPSIYLVAENDPWINAKESLDMINRSAINGHEIHLLNALHRIKENPEEAKRAFKKIVSTCKKHLQNVTLHDDEIEFPALREIGLQIKIERERNKISTSQNNAKESEKDFWGNYLENFKYIFSVNDYKDLMDKLIASLEPLDRNLKVLDAGCGNGNFGIWLMNNVSNLLRNTSRQSMIIQYLALDLVKSAVNHAKQLHDQHELTLSKKIKNQLLRTYQVGNLDEPLPFVNKTFDRIAVNLVISYVKSPEKSLVELYRTLNDGGKITLTSLKKDADLSQIFRNFIRNSSSEFEIKEALNLLGNAGKIILKESSGHYTFFNENGFHKLAKAACPDSSHVTVESCFSNQALMLTITKP